MSDSKQTTGARGSRIDDLAEEKRELEAQLARARTDTDTSKPDPALVERVRALTGRIAAIDAELEQFELAVEIERQKDA